MQKWFYKVGLKGEAMGLVSPNGGPSVDWIQGSLATGTKQTLKWYTAYFNAPGRDEPLALGMRSTGKGQVWINGQSIGRYWMVYANGDCSLCSYVGTFRPTKYHVPRSWLKPTQNLVVVVEQLGGDPSKITLVKRSVTGVCANLQEHHPNAENFDIDTAMKN
ncbi:beta-galactosidase [Prunus yedoensis var. nudiflora]|uniref:Beta-galactosidase n=1 Tax=Prunus yedoensis var. nudiflora TaxID=2094558 RepID=A0A314Y9C2_PRUYE|nr:beta-galactosidase [Prunus yedoensis var. nudiflora]